MGNVGMVWPRADAILAAAAQAARIPYVSSTVANVGMEELARIAPDSLWFQLYGMPADNHRLSLDMIARAEAVGAHALVITLDVPMRQKRVHDVRNGLVVPFKFRPRTVFDIARAPFWALEMLQKGQPRFENMRKYVGENASVGELASFVTQNMTTGVTWDDIARFREAWPRALVLKGIQHPADAERAVALGVDGIWVSNHGGRQFDAAPASIDTVPAIAAAVGGRAKILYDGSSARGSTCCGRWRRGRISASPGGPSCSRSRPSARPAAAMRRQPSWRRSAAPSARPACATWRRRARATVLHPNAVRFEPEGNAAGVEVPRRRVG